MFQLAANRVSSRSSALFVVGWSGTCKVLDHALVPDMRRNAPPWLGGSDDLHYLPGSLSVCMYGSDAEHWKMERNNKRILFGFTCSQPTGSR